MNTISVVIPFFRGEFFEEALRSVFAQTRRPDEIIVINDGAPGEDSEQLTLYESSIRIIHQVNQGPAVARNTGVNAASGEWIAFLDDDDIWEPDRLRILSDYVDEHPECNAVHNAVRRLGTEEVYWKSEVGIRDFLNTYPSPAKPSSVMIRRSVLLQVGLMNPVLALSEDYDCFLRVAITHRFHCVNVPLTHRRKHSNNLSRQFELKYRVRNRLLFLYADLYESEAERMAFAMRLNAVFLARAWRQRKCRAGFEILQLVRAHGISRIRVIIHALSILARMHGSALTRIQPA